ncbi:hypothetical protein RBH26_03645 [Natronolimnohabitans sp. A-GB9]|uniref:helix-turn-helix transcriptional regulator n=1 Tax=Natronolimnohabitans sp. A-GB9 TaxID=3069757 RepID=UPI0027B59E72|nr:hypothetical protein [Natronolimnohabitans sp. A-GB9]MDQ2049569.1 hypothetical protein [Natronolimnohabitans sp. A-GB9]
MNRRVGFLVVLVITGIVVGASPIASADSTRDESLYTVGLPEDIDADETRLEASLRSDGTATWTVEYRMRLDDDESREAFDSLRDDVDEDPDAYTDSFADRIESTVATASEATDREMSATEFGVETERQTLGPEYGAVRYSFEWHGFAAVDDDELHAGDAIEGLYLDDETRLSIGWGEEHELRTVAPEPDDRRDRVVIWHGSETDFVSGEPRVVVASEDTSLGLVALGGGAVGLLVLGGAAAWWYRTRMRPTERSVTDGSRASHDAEPDTPDDPSEAETEVGPDPRDDLLSNEEQVLRLLEEYDGRMKQQTVVEELEWTDAKTSKVVSGLRDEGKLESFRLGRENVLTLPEEGDDSDAEHETPRTK